MPPKKPQPKKQQPKPDEKSRCLAILETDKNLKNKQEPKKDGKGSIQKTTKDNKSPDAKGKDDKKGAKTDKNDKKDAKQSKDPKTDKKDAKETKETKDQKGLDKKDPNSKSIGKIDKSGAAQKPKPNAKGGKQMPNRHAQKQPPKAIINKIDQQPQVFQRVKGDDYLIKDTGLLQAYEHFLRTICKYGLPTGDIYEFAAQQIQKYERKKKARQLKMKAEMEIRKAASKRPVKEQFKQDFQNGG